ncbi:LamG-like jellyroll fold domain-containing protein [Actinosynnema sp. NPDC059335]|uniref:LamG-like jellyroll fold domain-containing protein n=1 Tax=Actinosynnema sp. NPDC059335 TaxID=3346804 RepID=UPI00366F9ACD
MGTNRARACAFALVALLLAGTAAGDVAGPVGPVFPSRATEAPQQRWGSAAGQPHLEPGVVNRELPRSHRGRHPRPTATPPPANTASVTAGPTAARSGFDPATSRERVEARGSRERVYANADGTETTEFSAVPVNYESGSGTLEPIDTTLAAADDGWRNTTNAVGLTLARHADGEHVVDLDGDHAFGYRLRDAAHRPGRADRDQVRYPDARPGVDLLLQARPGGLKETLVLKDALATREFEFALALRNLRAELRDQTLVLTDGGATRAVVPPGDMVDAAGAVSRGVRYSLVGDVVKVELDQSWLADPARRYPVLVDPTVTLPVDGAAADAAMSVQGSTSVAGGSELRVGRVAGVSTAAYVRFGSLVERLRGHVVFGAKLQVVEFDANSCQARPVAVHPVTQAWSATGSYAYPGPAVGAALASRSFAHGYVATGQSTSQCPAAAEVFDLGGDGARLVQGWSDGTAANNGLSLRADVSDAVSGKRFTGTATANPPRLFVRHSPYHAEYAIPDPVPNPPVLQNQDGKVKVTVTNRSAEAWAPADYYLAYRAYDARTGAAIGQRRAASLPGTVARGARVTVEATVQALPPGSYFLDFTMVRTGGVVFTDHQVPPARLALQVLDLAPVVQELHPPNGYRAPTLTPMLWGRALDVDAPPGASLSFRFEVCRADDATSCFDSGFQASPQWTVPDGRLSWGRGYLWRVVVRDAGNEVASPRSALDTVVPQPELVSRAAAASDEREFEPLTGGVSNVAVDATVATVGPELDVVRTYNSLDPRRDGVFGAGWTSRYDMRLVPDDDGSGNVVVTFPDGQAVRYGRDPDGSYAPPPGRVSSLTREAGGWRLADRTGTVHLFTAAGLLSRTTDRAGRSVVLTYNAADGRLAKAQVANSQSNTAGRALRFTWTGGHITSVTTDANTTWTYGYAGDTLTQACAPGGGCTKYAYSTGSHYRSAVLDSRPESYWRLGEAQGTAAGSEVSANLGEDAGAYVNAALGTAGALAGTTGTAASFNGSSTRLDLPKGLLKKSRDGAVELWFKANVTGAGGPLLGYQDKAFGTTPGRGVPVLYVGTDGRLRGGFGATTIAPLASPGAVNDGRWHHVVLSLMGATQTLYLDGARVATAAGVTLDHAQLTFNQVGAAEVSTPGSWPAWGAAGRRFFSGSVDEVAVYSHPLGPNAVSTHHRQGTTAADLVATVTRPSGNVSSRATYDVDLDRVTTYTDRDGGLWKIGPTVVYGGDDDLRRGVQVLDPGNRPSLYEFDAVTGHLLRSGTPLGLEAREEDEPAPEPEPVEQCSAPDPADPKFCTVIPGDAGGPVFVRHPVDGMAIRSFSYDDAGNLTAVTNENGDAVAMTYDARGNATSTTTCRRAGECHTSHTAYPAGDAADPRADQPSETRDARSAGATDPTYRTAYTYTATGDLATQTEPDGATVRHTYTNGAEAAVGGGIVPAGLPLTTTDARGKVTRYAYYANGDLARLTTPSGLVTHYSYDVLGRLTSEREVSDTFPAGVTTTYGYDALSRRTRVTEPATTDAVNGTKHQRQVSTAYDADGNQTAVEEVDLLGGGATRTTRTAYDESGRPVRVTDAEGGESTRDYDRFGNVVSTTNAAGTRHDFAYTARNALAEVRLRDYRGDDGGGLTDGYLVLRSYSYDFAGRKASETDAMGRRVEYTYFGDDRLHKAVLKGFHNPDGSTRDYVLEENTYDAAGHVVRAVTGDGTSTTTSAYDRSGNPTTVVHDPDGLALTTVTTYDAAGNVTRVSRSGKASNVPWPVSTAPEVVDYAYDDAGNAVRETVTAGDTTMVTTARYDQRGLKVSETSPRGNAPGADPAAFTTDTAYDELGREIAETAPPVSAEAVGGTPATVRPTSRTGYDAFGDQTASADEVGLVRRFTHDRLGRRVTEAEPGYRAPGATDTVTPTTRTRYDALGNVVEVTDPRGNSVRYTYDQLGRVVEVDRPMASDGDRAVWRHTYTRTGQELTGTDPLGGRTEATYDDLDRRVTSTVVERRPVADNLVSRFTYDDAGRVVRARTPGGAVTLTAYDPVGRVIRTTDPAGVVTRLGYDASGRAVRQSDGTGRTAQSTYDTAGRLVAQADLRADGSVIRTQRHAYDPEGNRTSSTDAMGVTSTFEYDADDRVVRQVEPVSATESITTSFGYDAAGRRTRYTDGRGNATTFTFNALGLVESLVEPSTPAHPALADRTWTAAYDANGNLVKMTAPGAVVTEVVYDAAGRPTSRSGSGASVPTPTRTRAYDPLDRPVAAGGPDGDNTYTYDDRGNLLSARGPSGSADFAYDADGRPTARTDAAGTSTFGYSGGRLATVTDGLTGTTQRYGYDVAGRLSTVDYGAGRVRAHGFDELGRTTSDVLRNTGGATVSSVTYRYDDNDRLIGKTTAAGEQSYRYDLAGRLVSWTSGAGTVDYAWDASGNRVRAGGRTATFDARNRLLHDGERAYTYTARGTLASRGEVTYEFDAFDQLVRAGGRTYAYDALDRLVQRGNGRFAYAGLSDEPVSDGVERYARGPADDLLAVGDRIALGDEHGDVVGAFLAADLALPRLTDTTTYDPFGKVLATTGDTGNLGFQGDWTDPDTGDVDMGARWYSPDSGTFLSRDRVDYTEGDSVLANRYTYGAADPLGNEDPDGNWPKFSCGVCKKVGDFVSSTAQKAVSFVRSPGSGLRRLEDFGKRLFKSAVKQVTGLVDKGRKLVAKVRNWGKRTYDSARKWVSRQWDKARSWGRRQWSRAKDGLDRARRGVGRLLKRAEDRGRRMIRDAGEKAERAREWAEETARRVEKARKAAVEKARREVTRKARAVIEWTAKQVPVKIVAAALKPVMSAVKPLVSAASHVPAAVVGVFRGDAAGVARVSRELVKAVVDASAAPAVGAVAAAREVAEIPVFQSLPCESAFNCAWRMTMGSGPLSLVGGDSAPDYLTLDASVAKAIGPLPVAFSRSISITVTSHGQVSWGMGAGVSTPGAGIGLRGGWLNKAQPTKEEINGFAVGPSAGWTATAQRYWIMPVVGTSHTLPDMREFAYEAGVSIGSPVKQPGDSPIDVGVGVSDSKCLIGCPRSSSW